MASSEVQITEDSSSMDEDPLDKAGQHGEDVQDECSSASQETQEEATVPRTLDKETDEEHEVANGNEDSDKKIEVPNPNGEQKEIEVSQQNGEHKEIEVSQQNGEHKEIEAPKQNSEHKEIEAPKQNGEDVQVPEGKDSFNEQIENLNVKLKLALKEVVNKDNLVKQHAKVAEDAISGWEKAEADAASFKQQLDGALQQKVLLEERVSHLDGALKECVKQMRSAKEEQEELAKKAKDWDTLKLELEQKLAEATQQATSNAGASEALQQRIGNLTTEASQAQAEARKFAAKVETLEKENASLRHDVRTLKKELVTLNGEAKAAKQQNAESAKKIAKLETECQKQKAMLRKRATALQGDISDRRKSLGRLTSSPRAESVEDASEVGSRECFALEEEAKTLKQVIDRKEKELQAARLMCARTASKLSLVEEQLAALCGTQDKPSLAGLNGQIEALRAFGNNDPSSITSQGSCNGDEADGWASALVAELAQFKKEREANKADKLLDTTSFDLMDDFLEMEKLTSNLPHENGQMWENREVTDREGTLDEKSAFETALVTKEKELAAANERCKALGERIAILENRLSVVPSANGQGQCNGTSGGEKASVLQEELPAVISKIISVLKSLAKDFDSDSLPPSFAAFKELAASGKHFQDEQDVLNFMLEVVTGLQALDELWAQSRSSHEDTVKGLDEANVLIKNLKGQLQQIKTEKEAAEISLDTAKQSIVELEKDLQLLREALDALKAENATLVERMSSSESEVSNMKLEREAAESKLEKLNEELSIARQTAQAKVDAGNQQIDKIREELVQAEADKVKLAEALETKVNRIAVLEEELRLEKAAAQSNLSALNVDVEKMVVESAQLKYEKQKLEKALSTAKEQLQEESSTLASHIEALEGDLKKAFVEKEVSQHLVEELKAQLQHLAVLEEEAEKLRTEKEASERSHSSIDAECARLRTEKSELEQKLHLAKERLATQSDSVAAMEEKLKILELQVAKLEYGLSQSEERLQTQQASFISLQDEYYQLKMEKEDMEQSLTISEQKVHQLQSRMDEECRLKEHNSLVYEQQLRALATEKETLAASSGKAVQQLEAELKMEVTGKEKLMQELASSIKFVEQLQEELQLVTAGNEKLNKELERSQNALEKLEGQLRSVEEDDQSKLNQAQDNIKLLEEECNRLKMEKMDLEEVLATTDEMVQGVKTECGSLSTVVEELNALKAEKKDLEDLLQAAHESIESVTGEIKKLEAEKAEVEHELRLSRMRWESQVFEANDLVASLRAELGLAVKSKQLVEEQLEESFSGKADLQFQVKAAKHEANQLEERSRNLELELGKERRATQEALSQVESFRQQLSRTAEKSENGPSIARSIQENFDVAAKLDECHRAILSLGQQLQSLSVSKTSPSMTEQTTSEESINNKNNNSTSVHNPSSTAMKDETPTADVSSSTAAVANIGDEKDTGSSAAVENGDSSSAGDQAKVFVPSIPLEGRARSKSMSPAKPKSSRNSSKSSAEELSKSLDMGSPSEKPPTSSSSSSAFSRFFRGKSGSSHNHH